MSNAIKLTTMIPIGNIALSRDVIISDPCYDPDTWCTIRTRLPKAKYSCNIYLENQRNAALVILKNGITEDNVDYKYIGSAGVDSGQLGIFDLDYFKTHQPDDDYENPDSWYSKVCHATIEPGYVITDGKGVCSSTYCGDGMYPVYEILHNGKVVGLRANFIE
ncbi:MAG: hypothetical protein IJ749_01965 [Eubacterium sp.]|nr:hypothetical protein [Eubacterium sp.]